MLWTRRVNDICTQLVQCKIIINWCRDSWLGKTIELSHKRNNKNKYIICNVYKPPNLLIDDINLFNNEFTNSLSYSSQFHRDTYVCDDFNIDLLLNSSNDSRMHVVEPPRGRSFIWQIGVNSSIHDRRQVDRGFYGVESVVRGNADLLHN